MDGVERLDGEKEMRRLNEVENPTKMVLVLGYDETRSQIIKALVDRNCTVDHTDGKIDGTSGYDFVVSYGYRHILTPDMIKTLGCPIFNLHISYLPFNRGAHPNFWSFYDNTPSGVTIHLIDEGVDTGPIVAQRYVDFAETEDTFAKTYAALTRAIEALFLENLDTILTDRWSASKQCGEGTHHNARDLPNNFSGWDSNIRDELARLEKEGLSYE